MYKNFIIKFIYVYIYKFYNLTNGYAYRNFIVKFIYVYIYKFYNITNGYGCICILKNNSCMNNNFPIGKSNRKK